MSDLRLRELERAWRETGNDADGEAYIHALKRYGGAEISWLAFAGYLGEPQMRRLFGMRGRCQVVNHKTLKRWVYRARPWYRVGWAKIAWAAASVAQTKRVDEPSRALLDSVLAWTSEPGPTTEAQVAKALAEVDAVGSLSRLAASAAGIAVTGRSATGVYESSRVAAFRATRAAVDGFARLRGAPYPDTDDYQYVQLAVVERLRP